MNKPYQHHLTRCVYMPEALADTIKKVAEQEDSNFSRLIVEVLCKEFLFNEIRSSSCAKAAEHTINEHEH